MGGFNERRILQLTRERRPYLKQRDITARQSSVKELCIKIEQAHHSIFLSRVNACEPRRIEETYDSTPSARLETGQFLYNNNSMEMVQRTRNLLLTMGHRGLPTPNGNKSNRPDISAAVVSREPSIISLGPRPIQISRARTSRYDCSIRTYMASGRNHHTHGTRRCNALGSRGSRMVSSRYKGWI